MGNICSCLRSNYYLAYYKQNTNKEQFYGNKTDIRKRKIIDSYTISKKYKKNKSSIDDVAIGGDRKSKTYDSYLDRARKNTIQRSYVIKSDDSYDNVYAPNTLPKSYNKHKSVDNLSLIDPISPLSRHSSSMRKSKSLDYLIQLLNV